MTNYITRFAPSPTGNLHLGSARTALINYILTSQNKSSKFYLRIEDTDKLRSKEEYKANIIEGLKWLGLKWEPEIQIQSKRIKRHIEIANILLKNNYAYKCNCSLEKLEQKRELIKNNKIKTKKICITCKDDKNVQLLKTDFVIRIKIPELGTINTEDTIQGKVSLDNNEIDDYILVRKDGTPTYMLSVVVDDYDLGVNYIVRGNDHFNNCFRQNFIYKFMNWEIPKYAHLPLINGEDGSKLSKRHGSVNILELRKKGYLKDSIINNLILLGWSHNPKGNEIISLNEIINNFNINNLSKSSSIFSYDKLNFFNNYYLRIADNFSLFEDYCKNNSLIINFYEADKEKLFKIFEVYKKNLNFYEELIDKLYIYFDKEYQLGRNLNFDNIFNNLFLEFKTKLESIDDWKIEKIENLIKNFVSEKKIKFHIIGKPIRFILINSNNGPSISEIFMILGKKVSIDRLNQYIIE